MRNLIFVCVAFATQVAFAATDIVKAFESKVAFCKASAEALLVDRVAFGENSKKWYHAMYSPVTATYDVTTTNSLVTPYRGVIVLKWFGAENLFDSEADARTLPTDLDDRGHSFSFELVFGYVSGEWKYADGTMTIGTRMRRGESIGKLDAMKLGKDAADPEAHRRYPNDPIYACITTP